MDGQSDLDLRNFQARWFFKLFVIFFLSVPEQFLCCHSLHCLVGDPMSLGCGCTIGSMFCILGCLGEMVWINWHQDEWLKNAKALEVE